MIHKVFTTLFFATCLVSTAVQALTAEQTIEIVAGVMDGVIQKDNLKEIKQCMTNVDTVTHQIEDIIKDFKSLSISGIFKGIEELGTFAAYIPVEFQQCEGIRPDIDRFSNWAKIFTHPSDLLVRLETNLPAHLNEIMVDVQAANLACDQGHFFDCGENYGEVLVLAVGQVTQTLQSIQ